MPSTPATPSHSKASTTPAASAPTAPASAKAPSRTAAKKSVQKTAKTDGTLIDKSVQKTTRKASPKAKRSSSFEKPAEAEWHRMISEAAYYRAERRGFQSGHEHEDWAWAEEEVRKILSP